MGCAVLCWLGLDWAESVGLGGLCCIVLVGIGLG